jgi:hypothetical protein
LQKLDPENLVDVKVVQNAKYLHDKKIKLASSSNMADDIQNVVSSMYQNPFIKSVITNSNQKPPTLYVTLTNKLRICRTA